MIQYNFDERANDVINFAFAEARDLGHRYVGTEHLVLGLSQIQGTQVHETFLYYKIEPEDIRLELIKLMGRGTVFNGIEGYTVRAKACLERSHAYAIQTNSAEILPEHIFLSIMQDKKSLGYKVMTKLSLDVSKIVGGVLKNDVFQSGGIIKNSQVEQFNVQREPEWERYDTVDRSVLERIGTNLTEMAREVPFDAVIGRGAEIQRMLQILSRRTKNNICLVGEPGVGKTALVKGLANLIVSGEVPEAIKNKEIIEINAGALISGTMYRGQFEERMSRLIQLLIQDKNLVVFFDELHTLIGAGATGDRSMDAVNLLKPHLSAGTIQMIGATTNEDFQKYIEPDSALMRRMTVVDVEEPSESETVDILLHVKTDYETHHGVVVTDEAIESAVKLSKRYMPQRKWPDKAIDLIDEACSRKRLDNIKALEAIHELRYRLSQMRAEKEQNILEMDFEAASKIQAEEKRILAHIERNDRAKALMSAQKLSVRREDIEGVVSDWVKIPVTALSSHERERLKHIYDFLSKEVFGQPAAVEAVSRSLKRARVGLKAPNRPMGVYLFVGPTGVGKTALAKAIAKVYYGSEKNLIRLDMSEYMEKHSVSRMIGAPPGYEGNREGGYLTGAVSKMPYAVVLFDEIEKAHEDVVNVLLQVMDEGMLTDGRGKTVSFRDALVIMTSNLGAGDVKKIMGFGSSSQSDDEERFREACKSYFKSEFINRMDEIVAFSPLGLEAASKVADQELEAFQHLLEDKPVVFEWDEKVPVWFAKQFYSEAYGARPMIRAIEHEIKDRVAEWLLESDAFLSARFSVESDQLIYDVVRGTEASGGES
jgi:ATP-dependent Clp protease ATP-binding subunit ClpC